MHLHLSPDSIYPFDARGIAKRFRHAAIFGALDALRAMARQPGTVTAFFARLGKELADLDDAQYRARRVVELMALVFQGSQLVQHGPAAVADAFCATRLAGDHGLAFGTLPTGVAVDAILRERVPETS